MKRCERPRSAGRGSTSLIVDTDLVEIAVVVNGDAAGIPTRVVLVADFDVHARAPVARERGSRIEPVAEDVGNVVAPAEDHVPVCRYGAGGWRGGIHVARCAGGGRYKVPRPLADLAVRDHHRDGSGQDAGQGCVIGGNGGLLRKRALDWRKSAADRQDAARQAHYRGDQRQCLEFHISTSFAKGGRQRRPESGKRKCATEVDPHRSSGAGFAILGTMRPPLASRIFGPSINARPIPSRQGSYLDITALGRQETWEDSPEGYPQTPPYKWWNWHDNYHTEDCPKS